MSDDDELLDIEHTDGAPVDHRRLPRRTYTDDERAAAIAAVPTFGGSINATACALGIPERTLNQWVNGDRCAHLLPLSDRKRLELAEKFEHLAELALDVSITKIGDLDAKSAAITAAVATDKLLLLRGEATAITEHRSEGEEQKREAIRQRYTRARVLKSEPLPAPEQPQNGAGPAPLSEAPDP